MAININDDIIDQIGENLLETINASDDLLNALDSLSQCISDNFSGGAKWGMTDLMDKSKRNINATIADSIQRNYDNLKTLQYAFKEVDRRVNCHNLELEEPGFLPSSSPINGGTRYERK